MGTRFPQACSHFGSLVTDDVSAEVIEPVDGQSSLPSFLVHDHGSEVICEQLVVGSQVQSKVPLNTTVTQNQNCTATSALHCLKLDL